MWKHRLCLGLSKSFSVPDTQQIKLIKNAGFDAFFSMWDPQTIGSLAKAGKENGLVFQSVHAPFNKAADFWVDDIVKGDAALAEMLACLNDCAKYNIPIMVAHAFIGFKDHTPTKIGLERFAKVVYQAKKYGVKIALENTEGEEYLFALMDEFKNNDTVGFCWDSGHEMCYNHSKDLLNIFGDRLIATHLNDNLGISSFDEGMTKGGREHSVRGRELAKKLLPQLPDRTLHLNCGGCRFCRRCAKQDGKPCRAPDNALSSLEAYGIDVYQTVKKTKLKYVNGTNTVTYFGIILF